MKKNSSTNAISAINTLITLIVWSLVKHHNTKTENETDINYNLLKKKGTKTMERTAFAMKNLLKEGWYDYKKGTEFKVLAQRTIMTLVEDSRGLEHWFKNEDLDFDTN